MKQPQIAITNSFFDCLMKSDKSTQKRTRETLMKFYNDPRQTGLNFEQLRREKDFAIYSIRVNYHYRAILYRKNELDTFVWIAPHDEAYDWSNKNAAMIDAMGERQPSFLFRENESFAETDNTPEAENRKLFENVSDRKLISMGLSEEQIRKLKQMTSLTELDRLKAHLPDELHTALSLIAEGEDPDEVISVFFHEEPTGTEHPAENVLKQSSVVIIKSEVKNLDAWVSDFLKKEGHPQTLTFDHKMLHAVWEEAVSQTPGASEFSVQFYKEACQRSIS